MPRTPERGFPSSADRPPGRLLPLLLLAAPLVLGGCRGRHAGPAETRVEPALLPMKYPGHNIVLVSFDALQAAHVGVLGNPRNATPTLDRVARKSFTFTRAISVASWTVPASMTWFTGVYPTEHGMTNKFAVYRPPVRRVANLREQAPHLVTLAEVLRDNGYATAGFTGNAGVSGVFGYDQGFEVYQHEKETFGGLNQSIPRALAWLRANRHRKFFLFLHGYDAHGQSTPTHGLDYRFVDHDYDRRYTGSEQEQEALREEGLQKGRLSLRPQDIRFWRAVYDEKIHCADALFSRFLDAFTRLGLAERTILIITSDHGTEFCEHGRFDHGFSLYDELIHVPLFVRLPRQGRGKFLTDQVSSIDVMPTILDLLDVAMPDRARGQLRGNSLVAAMQGQPVKRDVFAETDYREYTYQRAILSPDGWKLIVTLENGTRELYDLSQDPGEQHDRAAAEPARADELFRRLHAHYRGLGHDLTARRWQTGLNPVYPSQAKDAPGK